VRRYQHGQARPGGRNSRWGVPQDLTSHERPHASRSGLPLAASLFWPGSRHGLAGLLIQLHQLGICRWLLVTWVWSAGLAPELAGRLWASDSGDGQRSAVMGNSDTGSGGFGEGRWTIRPVEAGQLEVRWGSQLVAGYRFVDLQKPILYPVFGPGGHHMMRHYPLLKGIAGEATDHPHHKSIWFAHGNVNGHSYWDEKASVRVVAEPQIEAEAAAFVVRNQWMATEDVEAVVATEVTRVSFGNLEPERSPLEAGWWIQYQAKILATTGDITFGDTKEGFFAMRTHPNLRLTNDPRAGVTSANGRALNSRGQRDRELWGQSAQWVAYGGLIGEQAVTIVMMDHPTNLRHPTTWHARDYGLVAANPFGLHDFAKLPAGAGDFALSRGQSLEFCYRIAFLPTLLDEEAIWAAYREFAAGPNGWLE